MNVSFFLESLTDSQYSHLVSKWTAHKETDKDIVVYWESPECFLDLPLRNPKSKLERKRFVISQFWFWSWYTLFIAALAPFQNHWSQRKDFFPKITKKSILNIEFPFWGNSDTEIKILPYRQASEFLPPFSM